MLVVKTVIGPSRIHGFGLFAAEKINSGRIIWKFEPSLDIIIDENALALLLPLARRAFLHYCYHSGQSGRYVLCFDDARFINHSDNPNLVDDGGEISDVIAARDIEEGEELTSDYKIFDSDYLRKMYKGN